MNMWKETIPRVIRLHRTPADCSFPSVRVTRLRVYPVKSLAGEDVSSARVNPWGLDQDRRWGLVDSQGKKVTAREQNHLLGLSARALSDTEVQLTDRDGETINADMRTASDAIAVGHKRQGSAAVAHDHVNAWLSERAGLALRLVWQPDPSVRPIAPEDGGAPGDVMSLADAAPLLLITEASLRQLDDWTAPDTGPLDAVRFRPNVIIDGDEPFAEEGWTGVIIDDVAFRLTMVCDRCVMTTIDPSTLARGKEPIRALATHHARENKTWFGVRLTPLEHGRRINVGSRVEPWSSESRP